MNFRPHDAAHGLVYGFIGGLICWGLIVLVIWLVTS